MNKINHDETQNTDITKGELQNFELNKFKINNH